MISVSCLKVIGSYSFVCLSNIIICSCDFGFITYTLCQVFMVSWVVLTRFQQLQSFSSSLLSLRKLFEPRSNIPWLKKMIWVTGVLRGTVVSDWRFDNLSGSHLQSHLTLKMASSQVVEMSVANKPSSESLDSEDGFLTGCQNVSH